MQNRKTPTTLVWMAGILIVVGGFMLVRSVHKGNSNRGEVQNPLETSTTSVPVVDSTNSNTNTPNPETKISAYGNVTLHIGELVTFSDLKLKVLRVIEDSRCPAGVMCIQAGTVTLKIELVSGTGTSTKSISLNKSVTTEAETVSFLKAEPFKAQNHAISPSEYVFTFSVLKTKQSTSGTVVGKCYVGGCSGQICSDKPDQMSTCEYTPSYACYKTAKCERQTSGQCGFTQTPELSMCLKNAGAL